MTGDLDTAAGIAATDRITTTNSRSANGLHDKHGLNARNHDRRLIINFLCHNIHKLIELNESFSFSPKLPKIFPKIT